MVLRRKIIAKIQYDLEYLEWAEKYDFFELALSCVKLSFLENRRVTHDYQSDVKFVPRPSFFEDNSERTEEEDWA